MGDERIARRRVAMRVAEGRGETASPAGDADSTKLPARFVSSAMAVYAPSGGVWVGGTATLRPDELVFAAGRRRPAPHRRALHMSIPLRDVQNVFVTRSFPADVVTVMGDRVMMRLRCRRAQAFAEQIAHAVRDSRP